MDQLHLEIIGLIVGALGLGFGAAYFIFRRRSDVVIEIKGESLPEISQPGPPSLDTALAATRGVLFDRLKSIFSGGARQVAPLEELEEVLYTSDLGPSTVQSLMASMTEKLSKKQLYDFEFVRKTLKDQILEIVAPVSQSNGALLDSSFRFRGLEESVAEKPCVWLVVGVNGAGKTTTIGKLAGLVSDKNKLKVMIAAGDTFRAAAESQLTVWGERAGERGGDRGQVEIFNPPGSGKPSGVAFDACQKALKDKFDVLIIDTAGRLHTQVNLMEELKKIKRVIEKAIPGAPHEVLLVLDANNGQNAIVQARQFHEALGVTGVILTKLDGTAKGGVVVGLAHELKLPVKAIGVGEKITDIRPFSAEEFINSIL